MPVHPRGLLSGDKPDAVFPDIGIAIEALREGQSSALSVRRNPFRFGSTSGHAAGGLPSSSAAPLESDGGSVQRSREHADVTATAPGSPALGSGEAIRFIGVVEMRDGAGPVAVLVDDNGVHHGVVNDVVSGRYRILTVTATSVEVEDLVRGSRKRLRLTES